MNNLTVANRVHLLEPQWNPSVESQAIGRGLRQGQDKHVYVSRYIMKGTIEEVSHFYYLPLFRETEEGPGVHAN